MNFRTTYILLAVVIIALAILGIVVITSSDKSTAPSVEGYVLKSLRAADVKPDAITTVEIDLPGQTPDKIAFAREGKGWVMSSPSKARADSAAVESLVTGLLNAKVEKAADISSNLGAHGLDNPPVKITLKSEKLSETLSVGNVTIGGSSAVVYVTTSDAPDRVQAVKKSDLFALFKSEPPKGATNTAQLVKTITDFRPLRIVGDGIAGPIDQVVRSMAVRTDKDEIAIFREPGGAWKFRVPANYGEAASDAAEPVIPGKDGSGTIGSVGQLLNTISNIQPANRTQIIEANGDYLKYGLGPKSNPLQIDISRDDGVKETMFVGGPIKSGEAEKYYARHEADSVVYEVPAEPIKRVLSALANKNALRDRRVLRLNPGRIDAIDIETGGEKVELRRVGFGWNVYDAEGKGRPASGRAIMELINRLTAPQLAASFPPPGVPDEKMGFTKPTGEIRIWENGVIPPKTDPKADPGASAKPQVAAVPTARLVFGVKDVGDVVHVRRLVGDTKTDFFLPADAHQLAMRGRLDYIDATVKPLSPDPTLKQVVKLTFTRGKDVFELERPDDGKAASAAEWKINSPERLKGRIADPTTIVNLLQQLSAIHTNRVVSDKVTPDVLNRLKVNVDDNRLKVTALVKEPKDPLAKETKDVERVYYFGEDVGTDKKNVYMKPGDQDLVFEVERFVFDLFSKADVQDMVVHKIDKVNIKAVKITGWQEVLGAPSTIEIERKEGKWTLKSGMFELDPNKVDAFLNDLTTPRADAFVVYKTGPTPEHNLDVAKNALVIELTLEKGDPVKIAISPPNKEGKVFATTSALPGDVFTMLDRFAIVRAKPAALKKD